MNPKEHKLWPLFLRWCAKNQVDTKLEEDWISFWDTWKAGVLVGIELAKKHFKNR